MPVRQANSALIYEALRACGVRLIAALPENWLGELLRLAENDPEMMLVRVAKEEECIGIAAGAHLAGVRAALLMQNHGFLQTTNAIVSLALLYRIPLLLLISDRGHLGERDPWQIEGGRFTRRVLDASDQEVIHLRWVLDYANEDIAEQMGMASADEVRVVLQRSKRRLAKEIARMLEERSIGPSLLEPNDR